MKRKFHKIHQVQVIPYNIHNGIVRVLMVHSTENNVLVFPKGTIKKKETIFEAASRELYEESGCKIIGHIEEPQCFYTYIRKKKQRNVIVVPAFVVDLGKGYPEEDDRDKMWIELTIAQGRVKEFPKEYNRTTKKLLKQFIKGNM